MLDSRPDGRQGVPRAPAAVGEDQCVCGERERSAVAAAAMIRGQRGGRLLQLLPGGSSNVTVPLLPSLTFLGLPPFPSLPPAAWVRQLGHGHVHIALRAHYSKGELRLYSPHVLPFSILCHVCHPKDTL